jgi:phosphatidylglycerophosphatase A
VWHHAGVAASVPDSLLPTAGARPPLWATLVATSCGAGFMPLAPGHTGTATAVALAWGLSHVGAWAYGLALFVVTAVGTVAAEVWGHATGVPDDQRIVIDEVAGYLVTVMLVPRTLGNLVVGFFVFRLLDVWKPGPIGRADRALSGGVGVMADDLLAGAIGAFIMLPLHHSGVVRWTSMQLWMRIHG